MKTTAFTVKAREAHHAALKSLAHPKITKTGLKLWQQLRRIECAAHKSAEDYCNGVIDCDQWEIEQTKAIRLVVNCLGREPEGVFVNGDPRGYALKLDPEKTTVPHGMETDWGGYGILAAVIQ